MVVRPKPSVFRLFFIMQGSVVPRITPQILLVGGLSVLVVGMHHWKPAWLPGFNGTPFTLLGIALSIFLSFRNSASYDRWWEGRKQWGELIFCARNFARQTLILESGARTRLLGLTSAFAQALVPHLRPGWGSSEKVLRHLTMEEADEYRSSLCPPDVLMRLIGGDLARLRASGAIGDIPFQVLDRTVGDMALVQAACERIRNTPLPFGYTLLLHRTAYLFCFLLPLGFADTLGWGTPAIAMLVAYTFFGLDALSDEIEEPFGEAANDLPIAAMAEVIDLNMREALGEKDLPGLPQPVDSLLM